MASAFHVADARTPAREALAFHAGCRGGTQLLSARRMGGAMRLETMLPGTEPNVAMGAADSGARGLQFIAEAARNIEDWGVDGRATPETGHDPFMPCAIAA